MVPTPGSPPRVNGQRPFEGSRVCKGLLYVLAVVTGVPHATALESQAMAEVKTGRSGARWMRRTFAAHLRYVPRLYSVDGHPLVVLIIDNVRVNGQADRCTLAEHRHLEFYWQPSYRPQLNMVERFWKPLRCRAAHNRPFDSMLDPRRSPRASLV